MDRAEFKNVYKNASENLDVAETVKFLTNKYKNEKLMSFCAWEEYYVLAIEEMSELQKELTKGLRLKGDTYGLLEELADVYICLMYVQIAAGFTGEHINKAINVKISEIKRKMKECEVDD